MLPQDKMHFQLFIIICSSSLTILTIEKIMKSISLIKLIFVVVHFLLTSDSVCLLPSSYLSFFLLFSPSTQTHAFINIDIKEINCTHKLKLFILNILWLTWWLFHLIILHLYIECFWNTWTNTPDNSLCVKTKNPINIY